MPCPWSMPSSAPGPGPGSRGYSKMPAPLFCMVTPPSTKFSSFAARQVSPALSRWPYSCGNGLLMSFSTFSAISRLPSSPPCAALPPKSASILPAPGNSTGWSTIVIFPKDPSTTCRNISSSFSITFRFPVSLSNGTLAPGRRNGLGRRSFSAPSPAPAWLSWPAPAIPKRIGFRNAGSS